MFSKVLSGNQIDRIHQASLKILDCVGVNVPHEEILTRLADSGCRIDWQRQLVFISSDLIEKSLGQSGKQFTLYGRDLSKRAEFGFGQRNYNSTAGQAYWIEEVGYQRRFATLEDVVTASKFAGALPGINIVGAMSDPHELPVEYRCVEVMAQMVKSTTKPITFWFHDRASARFLVQMMVALRGDEKTASEYPLCYPFLEPISPLRFPFNGIDLLFETAKLNLPVPIGPMAQMGLSAPATVAGTLVQQNAEVLAGLCITQLIRPGLPVCYGGICHAFDMATTQLIFSGPEQAIFSVAMAEIGKAYGLPVYTNAGLTDSKHLDTQAGLEAGITLMVGAAGGADIFGHMGICGVDQASSLDMLVFQNELISYVESAMREIDFSDEALGLDVIERVGPGGMFIDRQHTAERFRKELWFPKLLDRSYYENWYESGAASMQERCRDRKRQILEDLEEEPLDNELESTLNGIVAAAKRELTQK